MIFPRLFAVIVLACATLGAAPPRALAQTETVDETVGEARNHSLFPLVTPAQAQQLALGQEIALDLRDVTLREVLIELEKQSGVPLTWSLDAQTLATKFTIDIDTPSFYAAFDAISKAAKVPLKLRHYNVNQPWEVMPGTAPLSHAPRVADGLFALGLSSLNRRISDTLDWRLGYAETRSLEAARAATVPKVEALTDANELNLTFDARPDPRLPIVGPARVRVTRAQDERGRSLLPALGKEEKSVYLWIYSVWSGPATKVTLSPPAPDARALAHLEGVAIYVLPTKREPWEVPDALGAGARDATDWAHEWSSNGQKVRAQIKSVGRSGDSINLDIEISNDNPDAWGEVGTPLFAITQAAQWMRFEDANGVVLRTRDGNSTNRKVVRDRLTFSAPSKRTPKGQTELQPPFKFVFDAPTQWVQTEVPFSFENVPLP